MAVDVAAPILSLHDIEKVVAPLGIAASIIELVDEDYVFRFFNQAYLQQSGRTQESVVNCLVGDAVPARLAALMIKNFDRCVRERRAIQYDEELIFPHGIRSWRTSLSPFFDDSQSVRFLVGLSAEVSDDKQREHELAHKQSDLDYANEAILRITSTLAHDLRAPLRKIALMADLVSEDFKDLGDNKLNFINRTRDIAHDAIAYVDLIVNEAKAIENQPVAPELVDFQRMIAHILSTLDPMENYLVSVASEPLYVERVALEVIVRNLLDNAIKFGERRLSIEVAPKGDDGLALSICDDGAGMSADLMEIVNGGKLVETGLGLRTVARLTQSRGGDLQASKSEMGGCKVTVTLPGRLAIGEHHLTQRAPAP